MAGFGADVKRRIMLGTFALSSGYYDAYYKKALQARNRISEEFRAVFQKVDFLEHCQELSREQLRQRKPLQRVSESFARVLSPLL